MSLLQHEALLAALDEKDDLGKRLVVSPLLDDAQVGEASIDLRLGTEFLTLRRTLRPGIDVLAEDADAQVNSLYERIVVPFGDGLWLHPQQFALGSTFEFIRLPPSMGAYVLSRSSWGRLGLLVATAIMVQPGFSGSLTLELVNAGDSPIKLYPGLPVAQLAVHSLVEATAFEKTKTYLAPTGPQAGRLDKDREALKKIVELGDALSRV